MVFQAKKGTHTRTFTSVNSYLEICFHDWSALKSYAGKIVEFKDVKKEMLNMWSVNNVAGGDSPESA